jgi:hypothetical protein
LAWTLFEAWAVPRTDLSSIRATDFLCP